MRRLLRATGLAAGMLLFSQGAWAADHIDSSAASGEPTADILDTYAWMSADATKLNMVMTVHNGATTTTTFSDATQYVFHVGSAAAYGGAETTTNIICTFDAAQAISCWAGDEYVTGDASAAEGIMSESGMLKVFAGLRNDPFVFNLTGFTATTTTVTSVASTLTLDADGCPALDAATANTLATQLGTGTDGAAAADDFAANNVLAIVVQVDKTVVGGGGDTISVWTSTRK